MASAVDLTRPGPWAGLFRSALVLTDHLATVLEQPVWSFGGGTVLMLRLDHRQSRDIDLFVPDPQYLGHVTPRLCEAAEGLTTDYVEAAEYVKLLLPTGEIDVVVGQPLTDTPWEMAVYEGRRIRVETNAEIIAKKFFFRGHAAKARDLFDLCAVADHDPASIETAAPYMKRHARAFVERLHASAAFAEAEFAQIRRISYQRPFEECMVLGESIMDALA